MKWLQDNQVGMVLASISGLFVLLVLGMAIVWSIPVPVEINEIQDGGKGSADTVLAAPRVSGMGELKVINERPVFNESRLPVIVEVDGGDALEDMSVAVKDAPDVRLTGIVITPDMKIATLTPSRGGPENVMAHEGESLIGEYVGWHVGKVNPRTVVLESSDGQQLELELQVHDMKIKEPPKPVMTAAIAQAATAQAASGQDGQTVGEDGQPLSRAEQIRQRIAERREELRLEQEAKQARSEQRGGRSSGSTNYQNAIRDLMNKSKDRDSNDEKDG